jgi:chemotaxis protein MotB
MARKKHIEEPNNQDRWMVSYADFITLLLAFFVVMYSVSSVNEGKYRMVSLSLVGAFGKLLPIQEQKIVTQQTSELLTKPDLLRKPFVVPEKSGVPEALQVERQKMTGLAQGILGALAPLIREGKVRVTQTSRGVSVEINASVLFAPGGSSLAPESTQALAAIASLLANDNHEIQVEGYTDNVPISNTNFPSNWELSAVRAGTVVRLFIDHGVPEERLTAVGQGPKKPVGSNDTLEGRARNRRVTITIMSVLPDVKTDVPIAPAEAVQPSGVVSAITPLVPASGVAAESAIKKTP